MTLALAYLVEQKMDLCNSAFLSREAVYRLARKGGMQDLVEIFTKKYNFVKTQGTFFSYCCLYR